MAVDPQAGEPEQEAGSRERPDLEAPLAIFREIADRLAQAGPRLSRTGLEGLYRHLASALADVLESARRQVEAGLAAFQEIRDLEEDDADVAVVTQLREGFQEASREVSRGLAEVEELLRSGPLSDLEATRDRLEVAGQRIRGGVQSLEALLDRLEEPELVEPGEPRSPRIPEALERLSEALESLHDYLQEGGRERLEKALGHLDESRDLVARALEEPAPQG